jgi:hypothetical protein
MVRQGRPEVRPVVQVTSEVAGADPATAAEAARGVILNWLRHKQRIKGIPKSAWNGEPFEIDASEDRPVSVEAFDNVWALRYDNPDREVNGRIWRTEAIVGLQERAALVGARLTTISRDWDVPIMRSVPRVIVDLAESPGLADYGEPLRATPWLVDTEQDVSYLVRLLENPDRTRSVYAISADAAGSTLVDAELLASRTAGLGHVVVVSFGAAWLLSEAIGDRLSVFGQAIRTYRRGFNRADALFEEHPVATRAWLERRFQDARQFMHVLANQAIDASVASSDLELRLPGFGKVREWVASRRLAAARNENAPDALQLRLYEESNASLADALRAKEQELEDARLAHMSLEDERDEALRQTRSLRSRIAFLDAALRAKEVVEPIEYPDRYEELDEWVARHLGERLSLLSRAARAAKKAEFENLQLVCDALSLLAGPYRDMRRGECDRAAFDRQCAELGVEISPTGDEASLMRWRDDYEVRWGKERRFLDMHLKKGTSREARGCLRIYFFWDEDGELVVVGHLPGHLTTANT